MSRLLPRRHLLARSDIWPVVPLVFGVYLTVHLLYPPDVESGGVPAWAPLLCYVLPSTIYVWLRVVQRRRRVPWPLLLTLILGTVQILLLLAVFAFISFTLNAETFWPAASTR